MVRGIRGAITVEKNTEERILAATTELLEELVKANEIEKENIASVFFSMTSDLDRIFPAVAAREMGWSNVALFCTQELEVKGSLAKCIRVLIHYNTDVVSSEISHVYLRKAKQLRPDLAN